MICSICNSAKTYGNYTACNNCLSGLYQSKNQIIKQGEVIVKTARIDEIINELHKKHFTRTEKIIEMLENLKKGG